ncbi:MAG: nucleotidyltransferase domain-containing protein [Nanoarchaeota archaeon]
MMLSEKEKKILLLLCKDFTSKYNARTISGKVNMTPRGALKALKNLEKQNFVAGKPFGKAIHYTISYTYFTKKTIELLLLEEAEFQYKRWLEEFKDFKEAEIIVLFGSVARKQREYQDVDLLLVVQKRNYPALRKRIEEKNSILLKKIHPVFQTITDLKNNIRKKDEVVLHTVQEGISLKGQYDLIEVIADVTGA